MYYNTSTNSHTGSGTQNPYQKYQQQSVMTMTQGEMLTKLYDEIIKQLTGAALFMEEKDFDMVNTALQKAQKIIQHLRQTLNFDYDISNSLDALYEYFNHQILQANMKKDAQMIKEIIPMVSELRETFMAADRSTRM